MRIALLRCVVAARAGRLRDVRRRPSRGRRAISPGRTMQFDSDPLDAKTQPAHLHEQGRRRPAATASAEAAVAATEPRAPPGAPAGAAATARRPARCSPPRWRCPASSRDGARAVRARPGRPRAPLPRLPRLAAGRRPDDGAQPVVLRAGAAVRYAGARRRARLRRDVRARRRSSSTRCRARPVWRHRLPHRGRRQGHQVLRPLRDRRRRRRTRREQDYLSRGGSVDVRSWTDDRNRTLRRSASAARTTGSTRPTASPPNAQAQHARVPGRRHAGAVANAIVQSNLTYSTGHGYYSDPYKPLDTRPDHRRTFAWLTRYNQYFRRARRDAEARRTATRTIRSATTRTCSRSRGCRRCRAASP